MKTTTTVFVGLLAGVTAGALIGVLLAPGKGSETRKKMMDKSGEFTEGIKDKFSEFKDGLKQKGEDIRQEADNQFAKVKPKFGEAKHEFGSSTM